MTRLPNDAARRHQLAERRTEQLSRVAGFLFMAPPTNPKNALWYAGTKTRSFHLTPVSRPVFADNRFAILEARDANPDAMIAYRPHQSTRECERRAG